MIPLNGMRLPADRYLIIIIMWFPLLAVLPSCPMLSRKWLLATDAFPGVVQFWSVLGFHTCEDALYPAWQSYIKSI
jgi:hypothetical protein